MAAGVTPTGPEDSETVGQNSGTMADAESRRAVPDTTAATSMSALSRSVTSWPTPATRDYRTPNSQDSQQRRNADSKRGQQLSNFVSHDSSLPAPTNSTDGEKCSQSTTALAPAQPAVRLLADGLAEDRAQWLRLLGNGVVPLQAAYAFCSLWAAMFLRLGHDSILHRRCRATDRSEWSTLTGTSSTPGWRPVK